MFGAAKAGRESGGEPDERDAERERGVLDGESWRPERKKRIMEVRGGGLREETRWGRGSLMRGPVEAPEQVCRPVYHGASRGEKLA